jgi:hypothetical protein
MLNQQVRSKLERSLASTKGRLFFSDMLMSRIITSRPRYAKHLCKRYKPCPGQPVNGRRSGPPRLLTLPRTWHTILTATLTQAKAAWNSTLPFKRHRPSLPIPRCHFHALAHRIHVSRDCLSYCYLSCRGASFTPRSTICYLSPPAFWEYNISQDHDQAFTRFICAYEASASLAST